MRLIALAGTEPEDMKVVGKGAVGDVSDAASSALIKQLAKIGGQTQLIALELLDVSPPPEPPDWAALTLGWRDLNISVLNLSVRAYNVLTREGITTLDELVTCSADTLRGMRNMGDDGVANVIYALTARGLCLAWPSS